MQGSADNVIANSWNFDHTHKVFKKIIVDVHIRDVPQIMIDNKIYSTIRCVSYATSIGRCRFFLIPDGSADRYLSMIITHSKVKRTVG
ncbi:hypothetical protein BFL40_10410 [Pseudomonas costantinii]|uniref:Uncharacterized protein n=1 Tax=Pseudomonas costantinii TaxID=168469 RepID=A0A1S2V3S7_9PSED|nr:hypothetical protein BFL40_10410 [Pseudomonas costantinii]